MNIFFSLQEKRGAIQYKTIYLSLRREESLFYLKHENFKCREIQAVSTYNLTKFSTPGKTKVEFRQPCLLLYFPYVTHSDQLVTFSTNAIYIFDQLFWYCVDTVLRNIATLLIFPPQYFVLFGQASWHSESQFLSQRLSPCPQAEKALNPNHWMAMYFPIIFFFFK